MVLLFGVTVKRRRVQCCTQVRGPSVTSSIVFFVLRLFVCCCWRGPFTTTRCHFVLLLCLQHFGGCNFTLGAPSCSTSVTPSGRLRCTPYSGEETGMHGGLPPV